MSERKPAPGMVLLRHPPNRGGSFAYCGAGCESFGGEDPLPGYYATIAAAADALRDHLRTEHADLWEECEECNGLGRYTGWPHTTCPHCHGRGYIERSDR